MIATNKNLQRTMRNSVYRRIIQKDELTLSYLNQSDILISRK